MAAARSVTVVVGSAPTQKNASRSPRTQGGHRIGQVEPRGADVVGSARPTAASTRWAT